MKKIYIISLVLNLFLIVDSRGQGLTANDILIAKDSVHSLTFDEQTGWNLKRMLMGKLLSDTSLISQDTSITNFYNAYKNDNIGLMSGIRLAIDSIHKTDSTTMAAIQSNLQVIKAFGSFLSQRYHSQSSPATLSSSQLDTLYVQAQPSGDSLVAAAAMNDSLYGVIQSTINARATAIRSINDALTSSKIYEQNEISLNTIYLSTIAIAQRDSLINYSTQLYNIASQCMLSGGPAVAYARNLYFLIDNSVWFNDDQICASPSDTCLVPPMPEIITGISAGVCGHQFNYSIDSMNNVTGYTWSTPGAVIDSGQGSTKVWISYPDTFVIGQISVYATDSCGSGIPRNLVITGYPASPDSINGASSVCAFASGISFSTDSVAKATSYTWVVPSGCTIDSGQGTTHIVVDWDSVPGNVIVVASNACSTSDSTSYYVSITDCRMSRPLGSNSGSASGDVKVYPNPTRGAVTVVYHLSSGNGVLQLYDVIGKLVGVYQLDANNNAFEFDASYLCCGIFEYRVMDNESMKGQGKLVIIR